MVISPHKAAPGRTAPAGTPPTLPGHPVRGRIPARENLSAGAYISVELAPVAVPDREAVVEVVRRLISLGPDARAGRTFADGYWIYEPEALDAQAEKMVRSLPPEFLDARALPRLREWVDPSMPFTVFLGEDRVALCIDHRLGDGFLGVMLTAAVFAGAGVPRSIVDAVEADPFPAALGTTFGRHPQRIRDVVRDRLRDHAEPYAGPTASATRQSLDLATGLMDAERYRSLVRWTRGKVPLSVSMMFALRAALEAEGVPVIDRGSILVDLRRYLPSGRSTLSNFVVGHPVSFTGGMQVAGERFTHDLRIARPLAALAVGVQRRKWRRATTSTVPVAADPTISDMGFLRALEQVPWSSDGPTIRVSVDPASRNGVTALTSVLGRRLNVSLSFDATLHDSSRIEAACRRLCDDPIGLLS